LGRGLVIVAFDEARFTLDADIRRCWAPIGSKPIVFRNGSKKAINIGGAYSSTEEFYPHRMNYQTKEEVLWNIKLLRMKYPKMLLLLDKATWHKNKMVLGYLERNNIPYMLFPTGASDLNPTEFCWKITRDEITSNVTFNSEEELHNALVSYWDKQPFKHNLLNYLGY
jgi:putative transposase